MSLLNAWLDNDGATAGATIAPKPAAPIRKAKAKPVAPAAPAKPAAAAPVAPVQVAAPVAPAAKAPAEIVTFRGHHARAIDGASNRQRIASRTMNNPAAPVLPAPVAAVAAPAAPASAANDGAPVRAANGLEAHALGDGLFYVVADGLPIAIMRAGNCPAPRKVELDPAVWADWKALERAAFVAKYL